MKICLNKLHFPVTSLGPGKRIGIWTQGCHIHCKGCISQDTWEPDIRKEIDVQLLLEWCCGLASQGYDGITVSGGEPFEQPEALAFLLEGFADFRDGSDQNFDILCYSGFPYSRLLQDYSEILSKLDAVISEPYVDTLPRGKIWRGSENQRLIPLSKLGHSRYAAFLETEFDQGGSLQVAMGAKEIWYIGIPDRGDMERLKRAVGKRGVRFGATSWRA